MTARTYGYVFLYKGNFSPTVSVSIGPDLIFGPNTYDSWPEACAAAFSYSVLYDLPVFAGDDQLAYEQWKRDGGLVP